MGTSKGYIPPTTIPWRDAKRAVSAFRREPLAGDLMQNAIARYAKARVGNGNENTNVTRAIIKTADFLNAVQTGTISSFLQNINRIDLLGKSTRELFDTLLYEFTNNSNTPTDRILNFVMSQVLENLGVKSEDDFVGINPVDFLLEFLAEYICSDFDFRFEEQLRKGVIPSDYETTQNNIHGFIRNTVFAMRDSEEIRSIDYSSLRNEQIVQDIMNETFNIFSRLYSKER